MIHYSVRTANIWTIKDHVTTFGLKKKKKLHD